MKKMNKISLTDYLASRSKELDKLREEINFLSGINLPLTIELDYDNIPNFYSGDYSLATDFKIEKRSKHLCGNSFPDGGWDIDRQDFYPQFYFLLNKDSETFRVLVQHQGFYDDSRIVIKSRNVIEGWKECSDQNRTQENYVDLKKVLSFFKEKGVKSNLLTKLGERVEEIF